MMKRNFHNLYPRLKGKLPTKCTGCGNKVTKKERCLSLMHHNTVLCNDCHDEAKANGGQIKIKKPQPKSDKKDRPVGYSALFEYELFITKNNGKRPKGRPPKGFDIRRIQNGKFKTGMQILRERSRKRSRI